MYTQIGKLVSVIMVDDVYNETDSGLNCISGPVSELVPPDTIFLT